MSRPREIRTADRLDYLAENHADDVDMALDGNDRPAAHVLLSPKMLAARWGKSVQALRKQRMRGRGPPWLQLGPRTVRYRLDFILDWEANHVVLTHAEAKALGLLQRAKPQPGRSGDGNRP
jgi:hypothetical protein